MAPSRAPGAVSEKSRVGQEVQALLVRRVVTLAVQECRLQVAVSHPHQPFTLQP